MRKILFRAKRTDNKEWIEGSYIESVVAASPFGYITPSHPTEPTQIYNVTLGQFTGMYDKNDKKIFEGDVFLYDNETKYLVKWDAEFCGFYAETDEETYDDYDCLGNFYSNLCEIIGNIHDNPELLNN